MKINKMMKVMIPAISACLLPLPAISNVATISNDQSRVIGCEKATNDLYYSVVGSNNQAIADENAIVINNFASNLLPTPEKLEFTKHDPINLDDPEDLGYYSVMLKPYMEGEVVIPETYKGLPVTQIDAVTSNNFSESLSSNVETIAIPSSITRIEHSAFYNSQVKNLVFYGNVPPTFADGAFCSCHHIEKIVAPDNYLDDYIDVFLSNSKILNCSSLDDVTYLPLSELTPLEYLPLVNKDGEIQGYSIKLDEKNANEQLNGAVVLPDEYNGLPILKLEDGMFANQQNITSIKLPSQLEVIGNQCFYNTNDLSSVTIPSTVKTIGQEVFVSSNKNVNKDVYFSNQKCILKDVDDACFNGVKNIYTPYSNTSIEDTQDTYHSYFNLGKSVKNKIHVQPTLDKYQLKDHHTNINGSYYDTLMITPKNEYGSNISINGPIIIPSSYSGLAVNAIKENCFTNYGNIPYIYFDDSYDLDHKTTTADEQLVIGENAFNNKSIKDVKLPRKNEYLVKENILYDTFGSQDNVFGDNITAIYVDDKISDNWTYYFDSYNSLISTFSNYENITMEFIGNVSQNKQKFLNFELREDGESYAVSLNTHNANIGDLKVLEVPSEYNGLPVVEILDYGFALDNQSLNASSNEISLSTIIIPDSIVKIGAHAFENCKSLQKVEFAQEGSLMIIDDYAFNGCDNIKSLYIPGTITSLSPTSFDNMTGLETITFNGMDEDNFKYKSSAPAFNGCKNLKSIYVPYISDEENNFKSYFIENQNKVKVIPSYEYFNFELVEEEIDGVQILDEESNEEQEYIDTYYKITPNAKLEANRNSVIELNFPSSLNGIPVKKVDGDFNNLHNLKKVYIGANIVSLGNEDINGNFKNFRYCENLQSIEVSYENTNFAMLYGTNNTSGCLIQGSEVDMDCSNIVTAIGQVDLYGEIYHIGEKSFKGCSAMTEFSILTQTYEEKQALGLKIDSTMGDLLNKAYSKEEIDQLENEIDSNEDLNYTFNDLMTYSLLFTVDEEAFHDCNNLTRVNFFSKETPVANIEGIEEVSTEELNKGHYGNDNSMLSIFDSLDDVKVRFYSLSHNTNPVENHYNGTICWNEMKDCSFAGANGDDWGINETLYRLRDHYEWFVQDIISELRTTNPEAADSLNRILYIDPEHASDILNEVFQVIDIIITVVTTVFVVYGLVEGIARGIAKASTKIAKSTKPKKIKSKKAKPTKKVTVEMQDYAFSGNKDGATFSVDTKFTEFDRKTKSVEIHKKRFSFETSGDFAKDNNLYGKFGKANKKNISKFCSQLISDEMGRTFGKDAKIVIRSHIF